MCVCEGTLCVSGLTWAVVPLLMRSHSVFKYLTMPGVAFLTAAREANRGGFIPSPRIIHPPRNIKTRLDYVWK